MSDRISIYRLIDPRNGETRYVGATENTEKRLYHHINYPHTPDLQNWIEELREEGLTPDLETEAVVERPNASDKEEELIYEYRSGKPLLNSKFVSGYESEKRQTLGKEKQHTRVPESVREKAREVQDEYDYPSLGEAIRHMCQDGGYDV